MAEINDKLKKLLQEVGEIVDVKDRNSAVWSLPQNKNALIVKHKALEKVSAHLGMWFDPPTMIENNTEKGVVALSVQGYIDDGKGKNTAWSIGEVSPKNTSNKYIYAMAEKRAIDRVILKLLGVHGDFYSEEEADEFKKSDPPKEPPKKESFDGKKELDKLAEKDETAKEVKKHFPDAEVVPYFDEVKYFKTLNDDEQKIVSEQDFINTMKEFVKLEGYDYQRSIKLWELNSDLFDLYKQKDKEKHAELMTWLSKETKGDK
tara:strand:- start:1423 stop:2205 length:783 start_codon:yes stop_codon:yes gene_type:complete